MHPRPSSIVRAMGLVLAGAACGSSSTPSELPDPDVAPHATNAAGIAYPTANVGAAPGKAIPNLAMQGYPDSNKAAGLQNVSLADFYDPMGTDHTVLYVSLAASWCAACASEASIMKSLGPAYRAKGVVMLEILVAGTASGYGPSRSELDAWIDGHATAWTVAADIRGHRFFGELGFRGVPSSMLIDTRTMKILHMAGGAPDDLGAYLKLGIDYVASHPL